MNKLSRYFSYFLGSSMALLFAGFVFDDLFILKLGLFTLISIPIFRGLYACVYFYNIRNSQGFWFSAAALILLFASAYLGAIH